LLDCRQRVSYTDPMKKPSSGLGIGVWAVGGLVGLYLLGYAFLFADWVMGSEFKGRLPMPVQDFIQIIYLPMRPVTEFLLRRLGII
jgi:hypothetical protein